MVAKQGNGPEMTVEEIFPSMNRTLSVDPNHTPTEKISSERKSFSGRYQDLGESGRSFLRIIVVSTSKSKVEGFSTKISFKVALPPLNKSASALATVTIGRNIGIPLPDWEVFTAANLVGAFHITRDGGQLHVRLSPVQVVEDSLTVFDQENVPIAKAWLQAKPLEPVEVTLQIPRDKTPSRILVKNEALNLDEQRLQRPTQIDSLFDAEGAYGLYLQGRDLSQLRQYENAETKINASLNKDPLLLPALGEMAKLKLFRMQYDSAFYFAKQALAIDTYDGAANYYYGKAAQK